MVRMRPPLPRDNHALVSWRNCSIETVADATTRILSLEIFVNNRYADVSTRDLRLNAISGLVADSVGMARHLEKDPYRSLPDKSLYLERGSADLEIRDVHYGAITSDARRKRASELGSIARDLSAGLRIVNVRSSMSDSLAESAKVASNGFSGTAASTSFTCGLEVTLMDADGRRPTGDEYATTRWLSDLPPQAVIAAEAVSRARDQLGAKKLQSARTSMVLEPRSAPRFVRAFLAAMTGTSLYQKQSFLEGQLGKPMANARLTFIDDPLLRKGLGSRLYDDEGITAKRMPLIEAGVLRTFYIDNYSSRKLGRIPTTGIPSNVVFNPGPSDLASLISNVKDGIVISGYNGGNSNSTTADFSFGISGYRIREGRREEAVTEMNAAGNLRELLGNLVAVGNDPHPYSAIRTPALVFEGVEFAGQ